MRVKTFFRRKTLSDLLNSPQHNKKTSIEKIATCTHLSKPILSSQVSLGNDLPGRVRRIAEIINHTIPGSREGLIRFNFFAIINQPG